MSDDPAKVDKFTVKLKRVASVNLMDLIGSIQKSSSNRAPQVNAQALQVSQAINYSYFV